MGEGVLLRYKEVLPVTPDTPMITMGEGDTPLVRSRRMGDELGCGALYFKLEGCNPTGSFKDRGIVVAVAKAMEAGHRTILCASTGNTSAAAAAYGAYCGLDTVVLVPKGTVAEGKLSQTIAYGARVVLLRGGFDEALELARSLADRFPMTLVNSVNPYRLQGQKTAAFEIIDVLGDAPDYLFIPVGNAGNITAYWMGFQEYHAAGKAQHRPCMMGYQAEGAAPIVLGHPVEAPSTIASALRIGNPASWRGAELARDESGGVIEAVSDEEIIEAYTMLAQQEGVFGEPASAASVAGLIQAVRRGLDLRDQTVVCVITGTGLKDPSIVLQNMGARLEEASADLEEVEGLLGLRASTASE